MRRLPAFLVALALVGAITLPAAPAAAFTPPPVGKMVGTPDFTPSPSKPRAWFINVLGSVLGSAAPSGWKAEQIANQHRYNYSWDMMDVQLGGGFKNGQYKTNPLSYDDYIIRNAEANWGRAATGTGANRSNVRDTFHDPTINKSGGPMKAPATRAQKFERGVAGGLAVLTGASIGFSVGKNVSGIFGFNAEQGLCEPTFEDLGLVALLTGTDCSLLNFPNDYTPNEDANGEPLFPMSCVTNSGNTWCMSVAGETVYNFTNGTYAGDTACVKLDPKYPTLSGTQEGVRFILLSHSGTYLSTDFRGNDSTTHLSTARQACAAAFGTEGAAWNVEYPFAGGGSLANYAAYGLCHGTVAQCTNNPGSRFAAQSFQEGDADPLRTLSCSVTGSNGQTYTAESAPYRESDGSLAQPECPALPEGVYPMSVAVDELGPNGPQRIYEEDTTDAYRDWMNTFPECDTGSCVQDLIYIPEGRSCGDDDLIQTCRDWFTDPQRDTKYQCMYKGEPVAVQNCYIYAGLFKEERIAAGAPYSDPNTGQWSGGQNAPTPSTIAFAEAVQNPDQERNCFPSGWAILNPVEWVVKPVQCALQWAFVPRPAVVAVEVARSELAWGQTPMGTIPAAVDGWGQTMTLDGCQGPPVNTGIFMPGESGQVVYPMSACSDPAATWAGVSSIAVGLTFSVLGVLAIIRQWGGVVGQRGIGSGA